MLSAKPGVMFREYIDARVKAATGSSSDMEVDSTEKNEDDKVD